MGSTSSTAATATSSASLALIDGLIAKHQVVVFSKTYCGYCARTKSLLSGLDQATDVHILELDTRPDGVEIQQALVQKTGQRTVPNVFVAAQHVGGNDDVHAAHQSGSLARLLTQWKQS